METNRKNIMISYIVLSVLFIGGVIFNDFIGIGGIHPDILLIFLVFLAFNEKPAFVITAAFAFGFLQDIFYPGSIQFWGLSPLFKTLLIYTFLKLLPYIRRLRGVVFYLSIFAAVLIYFIFYNLLYYSGHVKPFIIFYRYTLPETIYTIMILLVVAMIFPLYNKSNR